METIKGKPSGRWGKGQSGNLSGRPRGVGEVGKLRAAIATQMPELLNKLMAQAMAGDVAAARLLLERSIAPLKVQEQPVTLTLPGDGTLTEKGAAVLDAVASAQLAPGQGAQLLTGIGTLARIAELDALTARVAVLESKHGKP